MSTKTTLDRAQSQYAQFRDPQARDRLLVENLPLVKYIAGRLAIGLPKSVEMDDLISAGVIGLIEALNSFNISKGVKFETYASLRIRGAILDELRSVDWVPRSTRAKYREIERTISKLENDLGRSPTDEELAEGLGVSLHEYYEMIDDVSSATLLSLDELSYGSEDDRPVPLIDTLESTDQEDALSDLEREEMKRALAEAIGQLSEQERLVVALYYYEELTLKEIGQVMELSESRVSQIHTKAVLSLRVKLRRRFLR